MHRVGEEEEAHAVQRVHRDDGLDPVQPVLVKCDDPYIEASPKALGSLQYQTSSIIKDSSIGFETQFHSRVPLESSGAASPIPLQIST